MKLSAEIRMRGFGDFVGNVILFLDVQSELSSSAKRDFVLNTAETDCAACLLSLQGLPYILVEGPH